MLVRAGSGNPRVICHKHTRNASMDFAVIALCVIKIFGKCNAFALPAGLPKNPR
jgi:hypothetical protein